MSRQSVEGPVFPRSRGSPEYQRLGGLKIAPTSLDRSTNLKPKTSVEKKLHTATGSTTNTTNISASTDEDDEHNDAHKMHNIHRTYTYTHMHASRNEIPELRREACERWAGCYKPKITCPDHYF